MGGIGGGMGGGGGAGMGGGGAGGGFGGFGNGGISETGATMREMGRAHSRANEHAADIAKQNANENSVLNGSTVVAGPLSGLTIGTTVFDTNGVQIGTVERIVPGRNGVVRNVLVRGIDGRIYPLSAGSVSLNGTMLVATTLMASANRR